MCIALIAQAGLVRVMVGVMCVEGPACSACIQGHDRPLQGHTRWMQGRGMKVMRQGQREGCNSRVSRFDKVSQWLGNIRSEH